ncbi:PHA/PHB synthase family protein [Kribbella sp. NBC_00359]|uniref:PHA/PHB synthase family protein n=1 Tax=Kribbella sp. NBC_00359 TaxID=2975966 RepID=UPI002E236D88
MTTHDARADALAAPLDLLLTSAAIGPMRRLMPNASWARMTTGLAARPRTVAGRAVDLAGELGRIAIGHSDRAPSRRDRRFSDPAWTHNPVLRRIVQAYLAAAETAGALTADAHLEWRDRQRMGFVVDNVVEALAPSNNPLVNPVAWKALIDTAGLSSVAGARNLVRDLATAPRVPSMVEPTAFEVGTTVAATSGAVVFRNEILELIQYTPQTPKVRTVPLLIVPPVINKYYVVDLAPGRSMVEYFVAQGQQVFTISWRNPDARHRDWDLDTYGQAILDAMDAVQRICRTDSTHLFATCSGGILASMVLAHLADRGELDRVAGFTLAVSVLDQTHAGFASAALDERVAAAAVASSAAKGYLDGRALAEVFAWLRPTDLIWSYWVNNYLQGRPPAAFDVLFWNADTTRMTAALHRGFVELAMTNALTQPGKATMLGSAVDLGKVGTPSYVIAGIADHICPWQACYRSSQLLGGETRFVLSTAGHIASMVNPPGNPKATYQINETNPPDPDEWLRTATTEQGSWWPDYADWLGRRSGRLKAAPEDLGGGGLDPLEAAPGSYVREA